MNGWKFDIMKLRLRHLYEREGKLERLQKQIREERRELEKSVAFGEKATRGPAGPDACAVCHAPHAEIKLGKIRMCERCANKTK